MNAMRSPPEVVASEPYAIVPKIKAPESISERCPSLAQREAMSGCLQMTAGLPSVAGISSG
jgi:hypothetical protein